MKLIKLVSVFAFVLASGFAFAAAPGSIAVNSVTGGAVVTASDGTQKPLVAGDVIRDNTRVTTDKDSSVKIVLANGTVVFLKPSTTLDISQFTQNDPSAVAGQDFSTFSSEPEATAGSVTTVRLVKGTAFFKVAKLLPGSSLTVKTHAGNVSVKGTTFYVSVSGDGVSTGCVDGVITVSPVGRASVPLSAGKSATISSSSGTLSFSRVPVSAQNDAKVAFAQETEVRKTQSSVESENFISAEVPAWAADASVSGPSGDRVNSASSL